MAHGEVSSSRSRIKDYALLGDSLSAALVSKAGGIDWLCWPRFDSPSVFGAILGERAGTWRISPCAPARVSRRYLPGTNVLETRFDGDTGAVVLTDVMAVASEDDRRRMRIPEREIVRIVQCVAGEVEMKGFFDPRPAYGGERAVFEDRGPLGLRVETPDGLLTLRTDQPRSARDPHDVRRLRFRLRAGEEACFSLTFSSDGPAVLAPVREGARAALERSLAWWRAWTSNFHFEGPQRELVERSALALRLLFYAPSGAMVAAPTTSLPERIGGDLNWDYRFCWLRDASLTVRAFLGLGCLEEADAFLSWMLHATRLTWPELRILYDVTGRAPRPERTLDALPGHARSRPVRIGNAAADQLQLDVYGEVIEAAARFSAAGGTFDRTMEKMLCAFARWVAANWGRPDDGIWEPRTGKQHNTHSRLMCWTALTNVLAMSERGVLRGVPHAELENARAAIRGDIEAHAWNPRRGSYVATLEGDDLDASLLLLAHHGFEDACSERMQATFAAIDRELGAGDGLLRRYDPKDPRWAEGTFGICAFWAVEYLAMAGRIDEAIARFDRLCRFANDVGLFAEEIDPRTGDALGNFPQGFTHVGLVNAALTIAERMRS